MPQQHALVGRVLSHCHVLRFARNGLCATDVAVVAAAILSLSSEPRVSTQHFWHWLSRTKLSYKQKPLHVSLEICSAGRDDDDRCQAIDLMRTSTLQGSYLHGPIASVSH